MKFHFTAAGEVELVDQALVEMIAPGVYGPAPREGENSGAWIEVRDDGDRQLTHIPLYDPFGLRLEHHLPDGPIEMVEREMEDGTFEVLVPAIAGARTLVLYSSPPERGRLLEAAAEVGRFVLEPRPDERGPGERGDTEGS